MKNVAFIFVLFALCFGFGNIEIAKAEKSRTQKETEKIIDEVGKDYMKLLGAILKSKNCREAHINAYLFVYGSSKDFSVEKRLAHIPPEIFEIIKAMLFDFIDQFEVLEKEVSCKGLSVYAIGLAAEIMLEDGESKTKVKKDCETVYNSWSR